MRKSAVAREEELDEWVPFDDEPAWWWEEDVWSAPNRYLGPRYPALHAALRSFCNDVRYFEVGISVCFGLWEEALELQAVPAGYDGGRGSIPVPGSLVSDDEIVSSMRISVAEAEALTMETARAVRAWFRLTAHEAPIIQIVAHARQWPTVRLPL